jgi:hypothetical protein
MEEQKQELKVVPVRQVIKSSCATCGRDTTGRELGTITECTRTLANGCFDKGDGGW